MCTIGHRVRGVDLGAGLVAEDPERQHRGVDGAVLVDDRGDQRAVRGDVVGVELPGVHRCGSGRLDEGHLLVESVGITCGQHHRRPGSQKPRKFNADLAAAAQN